jgi:hypothetical protein
VNGAEPYASLFLSYAVLGPDVTRAAIGAKRVGAVVTLDFMGYRGRYTVEEIGQHGITFKAVP